MSNVLHPRRVSETLRSWRVLIVGASDPRADLPRYIANESASSLGFDVHVWYDNPDVDPSTGTDGSCVSAVIGSQIVIAVLTDRAGSEIRTDRADMVSATEVELLRSSGILPPLDSTARLPTVLQVEVLSARAFGRPLIVLMEDDLLRRLRDAIDELKGAVATLQAAVASPEDPTELIEAGRWRDLAIQYRTDELFAGLTFGHAIFLRRVMDEGPDNWVESVSFDAKDSVRLRERVEARLRRVPLSLVSTGTIERARRVEPQIGSADRALDRARSPLVPESLRRLLMDERLIDPPYRIDDVIGDEPLVDALTAALRSGQSVLVIGEPGLGKSTTVLITAARLRESEGNLTTFGRWRDIGGSDDVLRTVIGGEWMCEAWPLDLPEGAWRAVVDGLDESTRPASELIDMVSAAANLPGSALLCSVRESDYLRRFSDLNRVFDRVVELQPWSPRDVEEYVRRLRLHNRQRAASYVERHLLLGRQFISYPLWLSILGYLAERSGTVPIDDLPNDTAVLLTCARAVAEDECHRHGLSPEDAPTLERLWGRAAWELRKAGVPLAEDELLERAGVPNENSWQQAFRSVLEPFALDRISGFFHEVFQEFWLAQHIAATVLDGDINAVVTVFGVWRSRLTNQMLRGTLGVPEYRDQAAAVLREAYRAVPSADALTKNQLLYVVGRIDDSADSRAFLQDVWRDETEPLFARYSAGFAGAIAGESEIEADFASAIDKGGSFDEMNRGYHRAYWGDLVGIDERGLPVLDDGSGSAQQAIDALRRRLAEGEPASLRLRRIELVTLRRLVESRPTAEIPTAEELRGVLDDAVALVHGASSDGSFIESVKSAANALLEAIARRG